MKNRIKTLRKLNGLTQKELAERLSVSQQSIAQWEKSSNLLPVTAEKIAKALKCDVADIYGFSAHDRDEYREIEREISKLEKEIESIKADPSNYIEDPEGCMVFTASDLVKAIELELEEHYQHLQFIEDNNEIDSTSRENILDAPIIRYYNKLNSVGKTEAVKRVQELTEIPRYQANRSKPDPEDSE